MSGYEPDEPEYLVYCAAVRIGRRRRSAEVTIFYTPNGQFEVHNGYLAKNVKKTSNGRSYHRLKIVTPRGKVIHVHRYHDTQEFVITSPGYWLSQRDVAL